MRNLMVVFMIGLLTINNIAYSSVTIQTVRRIHEEQTRQDKEERKIEEDTRGN